MKCHQANARESVETAVRARLSGREPASVREAAGDQTVVGERNGLVELRSIRWRNGGNA